MATTQFHPPPAKRVRVQSDTNPQPRWLLVPTTSRTVEDLLKSLLLRLGLPGTSTYDLCLDGAPILPNEDIALVRDGEELHLRLRHSPTITPTQSNPSVDPHMSATSTPENTDALTRKRKRVLTPEGKRRRNARNRKREKRRRLERRKSEDLPEEESHLGCVEARNPAPQNVAIIEHPKQPQNPVQEAEPKLIQPNKVQFPAERLSLAKQNCASAVRVTIRTEHPDQDSRANGAVNEKKVTSPESAVPRVNIPNSGRQQHLPEGEKLQSVSLEVLPPSPPDYVPLAKAPSQPAARSADNAPSAPSQTQNPRLSYVLLRKVAIDPCTNNIPLTDSDGNQNENGSANKLEKEAEARSTEPRPPGQATSVEKSGHNIAQQNESEVSPADLRSIEAIPPEDAPSAKTSGPPDQTRPSAERIIAEKAPVEMREKPSATPSTKPGSNAKPTVTEIANDDRATGGKQPAAMGGQNRGVDAENALQTSVAKAAPQNHESRMSAPMENSNGSVDNPAVTGATHLAREEVPKAARVHEGCKQGSNGNINVSKNSNPRWKRRRPQRKQNNDDSPNSDSRPKLSLLNGGKKQSPQRKLPGREPLGPDQAKETETSLVDVNASGTKSTICDVIDLVADDEDDGQDDARLFDNLPVFHSDVIENRAKSISPQSIVVPHAEPQAGDPQTAQDDLLAVKTCSKVGKRGGPSLIQGAEEAANEEPKNAPISRRKPGRSKRLKKPEQSQSCNDVYAIAHPLSKEISIEKDFENLEALKKAVVQDLQSGTPEASIQDKNLKESVQESPVYRTPSKSPSSSAAKKSSKPEIQNEVKKKRRALKGGLSTLAALRVARAHASKRLSTPKDTNDTGLHNCGFGASTADESTRDRPKEMNNTTAAVKETTRRKARKGKRSAKRYLNEVQVNKSIFVGSTPETLLPPPELLKFLDTTDDFAEKEGVQEIVREPYAHAQPDIELSDRQQGAKPVSREKPRDNGNENRSLGTAATGGNGSNRNQKCTEADPLAQDSRLSSTDQTEARSEISVQVSQAPQEGGDTDRTHEPDNRTAQTLGSSLARDNPVWSMNGDCYRDDLIHMLQQTSRTLAKVWSQWEGSP